MNERTVSITGIGVCLPGAEDTGPAGLAGLLPDDLAAALSPGRGAGPGEPPERGSRYHDRASELALRAVGPALRDAGLTGDGAVPDHAVATIVSTGYAVLENVCATLDTIERATVTAISPMTAHAMSTHVIGSWVTIRYGLRGPCLTLCDGPTSGLDAFYWARNMIGSRRADAAVVIGVEPDTEPVARLLGEDPARLDGAVAVVVEASEHAAARGARPYADLGAYAWGTDLAETLPGVRSRPVDLWLPPENPAPGTAPPSAGPPGVRSADVAARLGRCGGALGVIQGAVAAALIDGGAAEAVLAACGGVRDTGTAAFVFAAPSRSGTGAGGTANRPENVTDNGEDPR